jgi:hypothetical protein
MAADFDELSRVVLSSMKRSFIQQSRKRENAGNLSLKRLWNRAALDARGVRLD